LKPSAKRAKPLRADWLSSLLGFGRNIDFQFSF
jgi:hypothetical protein